MSRQDRLTLFGIFAFYAILAGAFQAYDSMLAAAGIAVLTLLFGDHLV